MVLAIAACLAATGRVYAQRFTSQPQVHQKASAVIDEKAQQAYDEFKAGNLQEARAYLDRANPQDPYAMFVRAALTSDAVTAANMYKEIVAENEGTPIAMEALLRLYKYHYAAGQYSAAHRDYVELRKFPDPPSVKDPLGLRDSLRNAPPSEAEESQDSGPLGEETAETSPVQLYLVQVGVFTTAENARRFVQNLKIYGVNGTVFTKDEGGRTLYGVSAGSFTSRDAAEDMAKDLKSRSIDCIVVPQ